LPAWGVARIGCLVVALTGTVGLVVGVYTRKTDEAPIAEVATFEQRWPIFEISAEPASRSVPHAPMEARLPPEPEASPEPAPAVSQASFAPDSGSPDRTERLHLLLQLAHALDAGSLA
jgi:hypothetical protein